MMASFTKRLSQLSLWHFKKMHVKASTEIVAKNNTEHGSQFQSFKHCNEDLSETAPYFPATFNIAAYVNKSETLQKLVAMNADISKIEKKPHIFEKFLKLDFEKDIKDIILFLNDYVESDKVVNIISKNPLILTESVIDMRVRVNYLVSKCFSENQIQCIIEKNPYWLMFSTQRIDRRLGYFQDNFKLSGEEVRGLAATQPKLITYNLHHVKTNTFVIKEEMGFDKEIKSLLLRKPKLWLLNQKSLLGRFNYIHNVMKIPQKTILLHPQILECRTFKIKQRHLFLEKLGRAQFDPKKENYVPLMALAEGTDLDFCKKYAKCNVGSFNMFLKTM